MVKPNFPLKPTFENGLYVKSAHVSTEMDVIKRSMKSSLHMDLMNVLTWSDLCARFNKFGMKSIFNAAF